MSPFVFTLQGDFTSDRIYIEKTSSGAGRPLVDGAPFSSLSVSDRIKHFKNVRLPILRA